MDTESLREILPPEWRPWLAVLLLVVIGAATLEGAILSWRRPGSYDWRAYLSSMGDAIVRRAIDALGISLAAPWVAWAWEHRLTTVALDTPAAFILLFVGSELSYYAYHRTAHRVRWFWASHAVHHSPNQLTLATAVRLGWTGRFTGVAVFFVPLVWIGFPPVAVFGALALNLLYQFGLHAAWMPKLGPLEWVLNTPSHHRVHHGSQPEYLDCNYGGVLIVFDRLFGTFVAERDDLPPRYGLTTPLHSYNPVRIALHEWIRLAGDLRAAQGWLQRLRIVFGPPGDPPASHRIPSRDAS